MNERWLGMLPLIVVSLSSMDPFDQDRLRQFYDRFGARQDSQGFYEDAAIAELVREGKFASARSVLEVGCGTGKFAAHLLESELPSDARYVGIDIATTMVELARERVAPFAARAQVGQSAGGFEFSHLRGPFDRAVFAYVFDLLSVTQIDEALSGVHAALKPGGLLCVAGLTQGVGPLSRLTSGAWAMIHRIRPYLVGGCRPLRLAEHLDEGRWRVVHRQVVVSAWIPSEVVIAEKV